MEGGRAVEPGGLRGGPRGDPGAIHLGDERFANIHHVERLQPGERGIAAGAAEIQRGEDGGELIRLRAGDRVCEEGVVERG